MGAMNAVIGALRVVLGADTASLDKGFKESGSKLQAFADIAKASMTVAAAAVGAAAVAMGAQIKTAIENADKINKISQSTGTTVEEFSKLNYAAQLADVSQEALGKSLGKLSKAMVSAASDGAGPAGQAFAALGVSVRNTDGTLKSSSDVISEVAGKFVGYRDDAAKTALAIALFGKAGADMIPLLNLGKAGLEEAGEEAEKFGLVLDKKTTMAAEAFNDNLKRMDLIKQGVVMTVAAKMLPAFEQLSEVLLESRQNSTVMNAAAEMMTTVFKGLVSAAIQVPVIFSRIAAEASALWGALSAGSWEGFKKGWAAYNAEGEKTQQVMAELGVTVKNIWADVPTFSWESQAAGVRALNKEVMAVADQWGKVAAPVIAAENAQKNAVESFLSSQAKRAAGQVAEAQTIGLSVGAHEKLRIQLEAEAIAKEKNIPLTDALRLRIAQMGDTAAAAAMKLQGAQVTQEVMNPAEQFAQKMEQQRLLFEAGAISLDTYGKKQQQIAEQAGATWDIAGASIAGSFATMSNAFGKESSAMAATAKVFGIIQGTISMYTGAAKALELPFPANIAAMAAVLAKGASLVASIKGQSVPTGFKDGLSMTVPGGVGGGDSRLFQAMVEPGEQIDITPNRGGSRGRGGDGNEPRIIRIVADALGRPFIEALLPPLNEALRDGHRIELVTV